MDDRTQYIGASDAAAVLGLSRWQTPLAVWCAKTGQVKQEDISHKLPVKLGNALEQTVADLFEEATGKKVHRVLQTQYHPNYSFIAANLDRRVVGEDAVLECKTCSAWKAKEWDGEDIPQEYVLQVMHQLAVTGKKVGYIAVLIGNHDFKWKKIERDGALIGTMMQKEAEFWCKYVTTKEMPMQISCKDTPLLNELFSDVNEGEEIALPDDAEQLIDSLHALKEDKRSLEGQIEQQENMIKAMIKENEIGLTKKYRVQWKSISRKSVDTKKLKFEEPDIYDEYAKVTKYRTLRYKEVENDS